MPLSAFSNRTGGFSVAPYDSCNLALHVGDDPQTVMRNRGELYPAVYMNQTHSDRVIEVVELGSVDADAIVTRVPDLVLAVLVADCIPLLLRTPEAVAAVHVGRRGLVNGITEKTIAMMGDGHLEAIIGPSICSRCYEVGGDVAREVIALHPLARSQTLSGAPSLDLVRAVSALLSRYNADITFDNRCTVEDPTLFSYRRDGVTGRQAGFVSL